MDKASCHNCGKLLTEDDKTVTDGSGLVSHLYPHACIRHLQVLTENLMARVAELEKDTSVNLIPTE